MFGARVCVCVCLCVCVRVCWYSNWAHLDRIPSPPLLLARFKSDDSVSSGGFTFNYFATDASGSCGDGVVSALEACDPALSPACRFDCTTTSADNVGTLPTKRSHGEMIFCLLFGRLLWPTTYPALLISLPFSPGMVVRSNSGTYACDLVYATNNETASITYEPTKNTVHIWLACLRDLCAVFLPPPIPA